MLIVNPCIEVEKYNGIQIMKNIERACRTCYRSEDKITEDSYKNLLKNCISRRSRKCIRTRKNINKNDL